MKIVHISTSDKGGAGIAAFRLFKAQRETGHEVAFVSKTMTIDFEGKELQDHELTYKRMSLLERLFRKMNGIFGSRPRVKHIKTFNRLRSSLQCESANLPFSPYNLHEHHLVKQADIVHLHWVAGLIDYPGFFRSLDKNLIWTLHDMHPFLGLFHYQIDQTKNIQMVGDLEDSAIRIKVDAYRKKSEMVITSPSAWMLKRAEESGVFPERTIYETVPNSVDLSVFCPTSSVRKDLLPENSTPSFLFVSGIVTIPRKGLQVLIEALEHIEVEIDLLVAGSGELQIKNPLINVSNLGFVSDEQSLSELYNTVDALLLPSLEDNLPNTMLESLASGTPVIAFNEGGMAEHLGNPELGVLVEDISATAFKNGILKFIVDNRMGRYTSSRIREYAVAHFSSQLQVSLYERLYQEFLTRAN